MKRELKCHRSRQRPPTLALAAWARALVAVLMLGSPATHATPICRWVDANGRTHISDVVPDAYKKSATCTDSTKFELSAEQRREADQRAAAERARTLQGAKAPKAQASAPPPPDRPAPQAAVKRPTEMVTDETDCETWWRIYDESVECFGPYRTARGATKAEAFEKCNVVPSPETKCGPRRH